MKRLLIGGSPCTHWSIGQSKNREVTAEGLGWDLFKNYLIAKEKFKPDFFLYENNKSAAEPIKEQISMELGVELMYVDSALVSAQRRHRFYGHNIPNVEQPADRGILFKDVLSEDTPKYLTENEMHYMCRDVKRLSYGYIQYADAPKAKCITANIHKGVPYNALITKVDKASDVSYEVQNGEVTIGDKKYPVILKDGCYTFRKLSVAECCRLQTLPDDYCKAVSNAQAYKGIGNGWTAEVIMHILSHMNLDPNEPLEVLSMYDGIGTGRYCLDKLGFKNVTYYAYEIDKFAIQVATSNYPDIIECGDAFQVREDSWKLK